MDPKLLEILVCPHSKKKLITAPEALLNQVNKQISAGSCRNIEGQPVTEKIESALYQPEEKILYIIKNDIPLLTYENGIKT